MKGQLKLTLPEWIYEEDTGEVMCKCPECEGRMTIDVYTYWNPYRFCPYCGTELDEAREKLKAKRKDVYALEQEVRR